MTDQYKVIVAGDGVPPEAIGQVLDALDIIYTKLDAIDKRLQNNLAILEGAFLQHMQECHRSS